MELRWAVCLYRVCIRSGSETTVARSQREVQAGCGCWGQPEGQGWQDDRCQCGDDASSPVRLPPRQRCCSQDRSRKAAGGNAALAWGWPCGWGRWNAHNGILCSLLPYMSEFGLPAPLGSCILLRPLTWSRHTKAVNHCYLHDSPHNFSFKFIFFTSRHGVRCKLLALSFTSWDTWLCKFRAWGKQGPARAISTWCTVLRYLLFTETEELNAF